MKDSCRTGGSRSSRRRTCDARATHAPATPAHATAGGEALGNGDAIILGHDIIHSVVNPLEKLSGAIHVYDGPFLTTPRSMWNSETLAEQPYDYAAVAKGMPLQQ